jgi:DNA polymerase III delta prime subunit
MGEDSMKILLCGETGVGKTTFAYEIYKRFKNVHVVDGDEVRKFTGNFDYTDEGRRKNQADVLARVGLLTSLNKHVVISVQAPFPDIRRKYFGDCRIIRLTNKANDKVIENEVKPKYDYSDIKEVWEFTEVMENLDEYIGKLFPKVGVIGRFQPLHKGHSLPIEMAFKLSPNVTALIRKEAGDTFELEEVKENLLSKYDFRDVIFTPKLKAKDWSFVKEYDFIVQGNPEVIEKVEANGGKIYYFPRISSVSGTYLRENLEKEKDGKLIL